MRRKVFLWLFGLIVMAVAVSVNYLCLNDTSNRDTLIFANLEALTNEESSNGNGDYKRCHYGDVTSPASGGQVQMYCGTCSLQRIWPSGDGDCRLY